MRVGLAAGIIAALMGGTALAEDTWVQIEARPTLPEAVARAEAYAADLPDVAGFEMTSRWFVVALGPYPRGDARDLMGQLRDEGRIPADSYLTDGLTYRGRFFPAAVGPAAVGAPPVAPAVLSAEDAEAALPPDGRIAVQAALQWFGFYDGRLDGDFGSGTRASMAAWQRAQSYDDTGVLTPEERGTLVAAHADALAQIEAAKGDPALPPAALSDEERRALLAGLQPARPERTGSGFFVSADGAVLTSAATVEGCARVTLERGIPAAVARTEGGLSLLRPDRAIAPPAVARFGDAAAPEDIAVAGYSLEALPAPALTFGHVTGTEPPVLQLELASLPGDVGGPVLDMDGTVVGMLLPVDEDAARVLPEGMAHAMPGTDLARWLGTAPQPGGAAMTPNALARAGGAMTVQVSCWR